MPANHESTLYLVEIASRKTGRVTFEVFRTRAAARKRANAVNAGTASYATVNRAKWGADA